LLTQIVLILLSFISSSKQYKICVKLNHYLINKVFKAFVQKIGDLNMDAKINNHYLKIRKFKGIGADFRGVKIEVYKSKSDLRPIFSVYNEVSKPEIKEEKDVDYIKLVEYMKKRILRSIRQSKYTDYVTPMFKNHIRKLAEKGEKIVWDN